LIGNKSIVVVEVVVVVIAQVVVEIILDTVVVTIISKLTSWAELAAVGVLVNNLVASAIWSGWGSSEALCSLLIWRGTEWALSALVAGQEVAASNLVVSKTIVVWIDAIVVSLVTCLALWAVYTGTLVCVISLIACTIWSDWGSSDALCSRLIWGSSELALSTCIAIFVGTSD
jgi:hypothetical protein